VISVGPASRDPSTRGETGNAHPGILQGRSPRVSWRGPHKPRRRRRPSEHPAHGRRPCQHSADRREMGQTPVIHACRGPVPNWQNRLNEGPTVWCSIQAAPQRATDPPRPAWHAAPTGPVRGCRSATWEVRHMATRSSCLEAHTTRDGRTRHYLDPSPRPTWPGPQCLIRPQGMTCLGRAYSCTRLPGPLRPARDDGQQPWAKGAGNGDADWPTLGVRLRRPAPKEPRAHQLSPSQVGFLWISWRGAARVERQSSRGYKEGGWPSSRVWVNPVLRVTNPRRLTCKSWGCTLTLLFALPWGAGPRAWHAPGVTSGKRVHQCV
jgi:hypothetical protein